MKIPEPRKLPSGTWFIHLRLGGVNIPVSASSKAECKRLAMLIKAEHKAGVRKVSPSELTLDDAMRRYIERKEKSGKSPSTIRGYEGIRKNRFSEFSHRKVSSIRNWQEVYDSAAAGVSAKTMRNAWSFLKTVCAAECQFAIPKVEELEQQKRDMVFLDPDQIKVFLKAAQSSDYKIALLLCLHSCRASEVLAIDWNDVDLDNEVINVQGAIVPDKHHKFVERDQNKTEDSTRQIPIMIPELKNALEAVENKTGKVVKCHPETIRDEANRICRLNGLPEPGAHGLRRSFASLAYSLGVPIKVTMTIGGWKDYNTVMKFYTYLAKKDLIKNTEKFKDFFSGVQNANENANGAKNPADFNG